MVEAKVKSRANPETKMKRPILLTILGTAWFLIGLLGAVGDALQGRGLEIPGTNFINLLVGVGLLNGWRLARWYALFVSGAAFVFTLPFAPWALMNSGEIVFKFPALLRDQRPHELVSLVVLVSVLLVYLLASGWSLWVLSRSDVREFFAKKTAVTNPLSAI